MNPFQKLWIANQKCDNADYDYAASYDAYGHMMPMCRPCVPSDSKSRYVYMTKGQQCNEYIHEVFITIKNYVLLLYHVRVVKPFRISHIILRPLSRENLTLSHVINKGTDQSAHLARLKKNDQKYSHGGSTVPLWLDSRRRSSRVYHHRRHCIMSLSTLILAYYWFNP